jgi:2-deoxy-D-gluconate 3-dehydrogenase
MMLEDQNRPLSELISLKGKNAVVTGGARGLGYAMSRRFIEAEAGVAVIDTDAAAAAEAVKALGPNAFFYECDITDEAAVKATFSAITERRGSIDILVNNAGIYPRKPFVEMTGADFRKVVDVNLTGTFLCSRYAVAPMIEKRQGGCIINIASIEGIHPSSTGMTAYDASKAGVIMMTKSLARELGIHGIRVNAVAPGGMLTRAVYSHVGNADETEQKAQLKELKNFMKRMVLGRMGEADDIARAVLFLASDLSEYITGDVIAVDGGYLIS